MKQNYFKLKVVLVIFCAAAFFGGAFPLSVSAQGDIQVVDQRWDANFRDYLTFTLEAESSAEITEVELFYRVVGQIATSRNDANFTPGTSVTAKFTIDQTDPINYTPPGTEMEYWWKITDAAGNDLKTEKEKLTLLDNRYAWETLQNDRATLYWYEGGDSFGQELFDRANAALDTLETDIGLAVEDPIKIFIYAGHNDLMSAISTAAQEWTGGVAYTEEGVVVIGVHPAQLEWGLGAMTHEMTHLVIHQATENSFGDPLPRWLDEGIAVYNENQDELDEQFRASFDRAVAKNELMTLRTLSSPFPADSMQANLAYGQSGAVVKFIVDTYGSEAMANLLQIFGEGALYDEALQQSLGEDTDSLDNAFRTSLGLPLLPGTIVEAETAENAADEKIIGDENTEDSTQNTEENDALQSAQASSEADVDAPLQTDSSDEAASAAEESSNPLSALPCLAGLASLFVMGGLLYGRRVV